MPSAGDDFLAHLVCKDNVGVLLVSRQIDTHTCGKQACPGDYAPHCVCTQSGRCTLNVVRISLESLTSEAATLRNKISVAESENVRLTMQLSSAFSREKVEAYAVSQLGMCKLERYQIHYFSDRDGSDKVVVANGKEVKGSAQADATD